MAQCIGQDRIDDKRVGDERRARGPVRRLRPGEMQAPPLPCDDQQEHALQDEQCAEADGRRVDRAEEAQVIDPAHPEPQAAQEDADQSIGSRARRSAKMTAASAATSSAIGAGHTAEL